MKAHLSAPCVTRERGNKNTMGFLMVRRKKEEERKPSKGKDQRVLHNEAYAQVVPFERRYCIAVE